MADEKQQDVDTMLDRLLEGKEPEEIVGRDARDPGASEGDLQVEMSPSMISTPTWSQPVLG